MEQHVFLSSMLQNNQINSPSMIPFEPIKPNILRDKIVELAEIISATEKTNFVTKVLF